MNKKLKKLRSFLILPADYKKEGSEKISKIIILYSFFPLFCDEFFQLFFCELLSPWALAVGNEKTKQPKHWQHLQKLIIGEKNLNRIF